jgi:hypothetical protein
VVVVFVVSGPIAVDIIALKLLIKPSVIQKHTYDQATLNIPYTPS